MAEHTPTPWKFVPWHVEEGPSAVRSPAGDIVCTTASDADAQLIEKAVNNHDALVDRVEKLESALRVMIADAPEKCPDRGDYDFSNSGDVTDYGIALEQYSQAQIARAVLGRVGGVS